MVSRPGRAMPKVPGRTASFAAVVVLPAPVGPTSAITYGRPSGLRERRRQRCRLEARAHVVERGRGGGQHFHLRHAVVAHGARVQDHDVVAERAARP